MNTIPTPDQRPVAAISAWTDTAVDPHGHWPRSSYVEMYWLPVIGPTATWLLRRLNDVVRANPNGVEVDLADLATSMGLANRPNSPFERSIDRLVRFGLAQHTAYGLAIRTRIPDLAERHVRRLPESLQTSHRAAAADTPSLDELDRAHHIAVAMSATGDHPGDIEEQLEAIGIPASVAEAATARLTAVSS